jgi:hypothetical protein
MSRKRLIGLASITALATLSVLPALAQGAPRFYVNGVLARSGPVAGASGTNVVEFGTITMKSPFLGEIKCNVLVGAPVGNETEKGVASVDGWETWSCHMPECFHGSPSTVMAEASPEFGVVPERTIKEVQRHQKTLPWPAELTAPEGRTSLRIGDTEKLPLAPVKFYVECPKELFDVLYEGTLEPHIVNGTKNGLKPSHLEFEGEGGKTGHLKSPDIFGGKEPESLLFIKGELPLLGTGQQLITAE